MKRLLLFISLLSSGCSDVENPLIIQHKYKPINQVYDSRALVGTGDFNPKYVPILWK